MGAALKGSEACVKALLRAKANPDLQDIDGFTALMWAAFKGHEPCVQALLLKANTELFDEGGRTALQHAEVEGHTATAQLLRQHAAPPQPAAAAPAAPPDAGEPAEGAPASLPLEILGSAGRGELPKVVKWLRRSTRSALLHASTVHPQPRPCCTPPQPTTTWRW